MIIQDSHKTTCVENHQESSRNSCQNLVAEPKQRMSLSIGSTSVVMRPAPLKGDVRLWDAALVTFSSLRGNLYSQTFLGLGVEEQGVATWFIGPRTIKYDFMHKMTSLELSPELRYILGRCLASKNAQPNCWLSSILLDIFKKSLLKNL